MAKLAYFCDMKLEVKVAILFLFFSVFAFGQQEQEMFSLDENDIASDNSYDKTEIVSASRSSKYLKDLPMTIYVITRDEILKNGYTSLVDVLKDIPGIKVSQPGSGIEGETFLMRGLIGNYYAKILVNSIPIQPSVVSGMPLAGQLPVREAERIEVIVGPASSIYGGDALAGVINIITKTSERPVWGQADISLGDFGSSNINVMIGGKVGKKKNILQYSFYGSSSKLEDMNVKYDIPNLYNPSVYDSTYSFLQEPFYKGDSTSPKFGDLPANSGQVGFSLSYRDFTFSYMKMWRRTHSSIGQETDIYAYYDPSNFWGEDIQRYSLSYNKTWGKLSNKTSLSYLTYRLDNSSSFRMIIDAGDMGKLYKYAASDDILLDEVLNYNILSNLDLTGGFSIQFSGNLPKTNDLSEPFGKTLYSPFSTDVNYSDPLLGKFGINPVNFYNIGGFLQLFYKMNKFTFVIGDRYDYNSLYGSKNNPRIALMYEIRNNLSIRGSFGTAFRTPSLYFAYSSLAYPDGDGFFYRTVPDKDLKPELFYEAELGMRYNNKKRFSSDIAIYYHRINNQITNSLIFLDPQQYPDATNPEGLATSFVNDENSQASLFGIQANLRVKNLVNPVKLNGSLYVSYSKGEEILPNNLGKLDQYRQMPIWMAQLNFDMSPWRPLVFVFRNILSSKWEKRYFPLPPEVMKLAGLPTSVKGFYTLDFITRYSISKNLNAFINVNNVFNAYYGGIDAYNDITNLVYNPQYGRTFRIGFTFRLE